MEFSSCLTVFAIIVFILGSETWMIMALWNWIVVFMFGAPEITFWTAAGLMLLINLLSGGIRITTKN